MINKVTLVGNIGQDVELKQTQSGKAVARLSLATNESYKDSAGEWQQKTEWHTVIVWGQAAEKAGQYQKGEMIYLEGKLSHRSYEDREGVKRKVTEVVASYIRKLTPKATNPGQQATAPQPQQTGRQGNLNANTASSSAASEEDDLPF